MGCSGDGWRETRRRKWAHGGKRESGDTWEKNGTRA